MNTITTTAPTNPVPARRKCFIRHDLTATLPGLAHRVLRAEFASQDDIARAYGVDKGTVSRWKYEAHIRGLIDLTDWRRGLLVAKLRATV